MGVREFVRVRNVLLVLGCTFLFLLEFGFGETM
jgi:hypothetical protein